jgi:hypothetical protein
MFAEAVSVGPVRKEGHREESRETTSRSEISRNL